MTKLIYAVDESEFGIEQQRRMASIAAYVDCYKFGHEMMTAEDDEGRTAASRARKFCQEELHKDVFWDIKLLDARHTVEKTVRNIGLMNVQMFTIHPQASNEALLAASTTAKKYNMRALAPLVLTDLDDDQCIERFGINIGAATLRFGHNIVRERGIRSYVCSVHEAAFIRYHGVLFGPDAYIVTPGIRPLWAPEEKVQKRIGTPTQAVEAGADAIVVGGPISSPPATIGTPAAAAKLIREELDAAVFKP